MKFIIGRKVGMTRVFDDEGRHLAVSIVKALPCTVSAIKTKEKDGYESVQVKAFKDKEKKRVARTTEFLEENPKRYKIGEEIKLAQFQTNELVTVEGKSKGKGFAGTIKRHGFHSGPKSHGSNNIREPGSIGSGYPERVVLGRKMPGKTGAETVSVKNLKIVDLDNETILISGAIPGPVRGVVKIFGKGEKAEEEIDATALEEQAAMAKMLEEQKAEKEEADKEKTEAEKLEENQEKIGVEKLENETKEEQPKEDVEEKKE
jgi:large subunit ribosomal protein L3